jgi:hypothetical protein
MDYTKSNLMNGKYRGSKVKSRSGFYIVLSIVFLVVLFKWGLPLFFNVISGPANKQSATAFKDNVPPQVPMISALPEATNAAKIRIEGFTEKEVDTDLLINDNVVDTEKTDANGAIILNGTLEAGSNRIIVRATDSSSNTSQSPVILINFDSKPVDLTVTSPKDGSEYFGGTNQTVDIKGTVSKPTATVIVNGSYAMVDKDGNFTQRIMLANGDNNIKIKATDTAGNTAESSLKLVFSQ